MLETAPNSFSLRSPLEGGLGGHAPRGGYGAAAIIVLHGSIGSVENHQGGNAANGKLGAQSLNLVLSGKGNGSPRHGAVVLRERGIVVVAGGKNDCQRRRVFLLKLLEELCQYRGKATARRALNGNNGYRGKLAA
jgi:hypothetical protein